LARTKLAMKTAKPPQDVTTSPQALQRLLLLDEAINSTKEMIVITDRQGRIEFVNEAFVSTTGYSREEAVGASIGILKSGDQTPEFYDDFWTTILAGKTWEGELTNRRRNGSLYVEWMRVTPIVEEDHQISHFVAVKLDITKKKETEARERASRRFFERLIDTIPLPVFAKDAFGVYSFCNAQFEELIGLPRNEIIGKTVQDLAPPEHAEHHLNADDQMLFGGTRQVYDVPFASKQGETKVYRFHKTCVRGDSNEIVGLVGVIDPNPQQQLSDEMKNEDSVRSLEEVITFLNHEIQNPLAGIQTSSEVLQLPGTPAEQRESLTRLIGDESRKLSRTVLNALLITQISTGTFPWNWQLIKLSELCAGLGQLFSSKVDEERNLLFRYSPAETAVQLNGDPDTLIRVLTILLENAMQYTESGSIDFSLDVVERKGGIFARIEIRDSGPGIHPEILKKLDRPFSLSRGLLGPRQAEGSGLGLTLARKIVLAHQGEMKIDSEVDSGTSIRIYLPMRTQRPLEETR